MRRLLLVLLALFPLAAAANDFKPDDMVVTSLATEGWVTTKTARVMVSVNAAVTASSAGTTRDAMLKAVQQLGPKGEWRITSFNRSQDATGMEQWYANFEARLPEVDLGGINEKAKGASKPGMQLSVAQVDFTPTLDETEAVRADLRKKIMEQAAKELAAINGTLNGRTYRIAAINFGGMHAPMPMMAPRAMMMKAMADGAVAESAGEAPVETAQKIQMTATVTYAALAPAGEGGK